MTATIRRADPIFVTSKETVCVNESDIFRAVRDRIDFLGSSSGNLKLAPR